MLLITSERNTPHINPLIHTQSHRHTVTDRYTFTAVNLKRAHLAGLGPAAQSCFSVPAVLQKLFIGPVLCVCVGVQLLHRSTGGGLH